jgi:hypothetical protein
MISVEAELDLRCRTAAPLCADDGQRRPLPDPQRCADSCFRRRAGGDRRFFISLAVLRLLDETSSDGPLACIIDDAHWLDPASMQVLAFVARRLRTESVALVFAVDEPTPELDGLPELTIDRLSDTEAHALLASVVPGVLGARLRDRIVAESQGNPRALVALSQGVTAEQLAGRFALPAVLSSLGPLAGALRLQLERLPVPTRHRSLVAAEPEGDPTPLWRAAARPGIEPNAVDDAESSGLPEVRHTRDLRIHAQVIGRISRCPLRSPPTRTKRWRMRLAGNGT